MKRVALVLALLSLLAMALGLKRAQWLPGAPSRAASSIRIAHPDLNRDAATKVPPPNPIAAKIVVAARAQIGTTYDSRYRQIAYPNGDVPPDRGVCTDVVIRALRKAGYDLQRLIHEDMRRHFDVYPQKWGLRQPDRNIDHRRVPNQMCFLKRHGVTLTKDVSARTLTQWQPGDIVCWELPTGQFHIGVVSDALHENGRPLVIHNISICAEEDCLTAWKIIGHFRYPRVYRHR